MTDSPTAPDVPPCSLQSSMRRRGARVIRVLQQWAREHPHPPTSRPCSTHKENLAWARAVFKKYLG